MVFFASRLFSVFPNWLRSPSHFLLLASISLPAEYHVIRCFCAVVGLSESFSQFLDRDPQRPMNRGCVHLETAADLAEGESAEEMEPHAFSFPRGEAPSHAVADAAEQKPLPYSPGQSFLNFFGGFVPQAADLAELCEEPGFPKPAESFGATAFCVCHRLVSLLLRTAHVRVSFQDHGSAEAVEKDFAGTAKSL